MAARRVSAAEYAAQRDRTTAEQLNLLVADPAFKAWEERKATRGRLAAAAANTALAVGCVLLVLALALLRPTPTAAPHQVVPVAEPAAPAFNPITAIPTEASAALGACEPSAAAEQLEELRRKLGAARQEAEAATAALADRDLQLRSERAARPADAQLVEQAKSALAATQQLRTDNEQLAADKQRLATENRQLAADKLRLAAANQRLTTENQQLAATNKQLTADNHQLTADKQRLTTENQQLAAAAAAAASLTEATASVAMAALSDVPAAAPAAIATLLPPPVAAALAGPAAAAYAILAGLVVAALAVLLLLRSRRAAAAHAAHAVALAARLKETAFARDTAEKSLELLEGELQHRMKQLGDAQQRAADAASPRIGTAPQPPPAHTPGKGELPPPPASLVEKFLADHNFMAVQQDQMQEWLEMEQQFREMQAVVEELQGELAERDERLAAHEQECTTPAHEHATVELRARDDQLSQLRGWLDEAQEELLNTQGALAEREAECRRVSAQLEALQVVAGVAQESANGMEGREAALVAQNLELVAQLQAVTAAHEDMRAQLSAAAAAGNSAALALGTFGTSSARPASAASTVPGTPADLSAEVQSCLELMRATRAQLADRLQHSQGVCEEMIAGCQQGAAGQDGEVAAGHAANSGAFGSPAPASPTSQHEVEVEPAVLGVSRRHHANVEASPSPSSKLSGGSGWGGSSCSPSVSPRSDCGAPSPSKAAQARVAEARGRSTAWDLAGFVRLLGFEFEDAPVPVERSEFLALKQAAQEALAAAADGAAGRQERAVAREALKVLGAWEWPAGRIATPPPSPFWRMLGLES